MSKQIVAEYGMDYELLKPDELDAHVRAGTFRLAFVGMSNAGKSYRSRVLQTELDFYWYEVDKAIQKDLGFSDMDSISTWMGLPTTETYEARAAQYLAAEERCTHLAHLDTGDKNLCFDTTGSVIYLSEETRNWLHDQCLIVNIDLDESAIEKMVERYLREPKPVQWGGLYQPEVGESEEETLRRCYPKLLADRLFKYRDLAHLSIPFSEFYDLSANETLEVIKSHLSDSRQT